MNTAFTLSLTTLLNFSQIFHNFTLSFGFCFSRVLTLMYAKYIQPRLHQRVVDVNNQDPVDNRLGDALRV